MKKFFSNFKNSVDKLLSFQLIIVLVLVFSFFLPNLLSGKIPMPADTILGLYHPFRDISVDGFSPGKFPAKNPLITDPVLQIYSWKNLVINEIEEGSIPLWNPYSFAGQPLLANVQSSPLAFANILLLILPFNIAWGVLVILQALLTSVFMYLFLREINLSRVASSFGAFILPFTGFYMVWLTWGTIVATAMWLPLLLLAVEKLFKKVSPLWFLLLSLTSSQVIFSGHLQTALYVFLSLMIFIIFRLIVFKKTFAFVVSLLAVILGLLTSAIQIFPTLEFINHSARNIDQLYTADRLDWFIPFQNLIQLVAPDFFGNPATYNYWGVWNYAEFVTFIGIIPLALVVFSLSSKNSHKRFFLILLLTGLVLSLSNPVSKIPYIFHLPFISSLQPSRIIFLIVFALTVLASLGLDQFLQIKSKNKVLLLGIILFLILSTIAAITFFNKGLFPYVNNLDPRYIALRNLAIPLIFAAFFIAISLSKFVNAPRFLIIGVIFSLTLVELFRFGHKFTPFSKLSWIFPQTETTKFLAGQTEPFRIMAVDRRVMHPNISGIYHIESVDGYDPLYSKDYAQYISVSESQDPGTKLASFNRIITPQRFSSNLINLLGVRFILSLDNIDSPDFSLVLREGQTKVYENTKSFPRAFFVDEVLKELSPKGEYSKLLDQNFDLSKKATSTEYEFKDEDIDSNLQIIKYSAQNILLSTKSEKKRPLIITNLNYPGWQAKIDNERTAIYEVDSIFQLIEIPQGEHNVEFKFKPKSFYNGLYVSAFALMTTFACSIFIWRRKYQ